MSNHYERSVDLVYEVQQLRDNLGRAYDAPHGTSAVIASLHQEIGAKLKLASIHADLAVAQAVQDLHNLIDQRVGVLR